MIGLIFFNKGLVQLIPLESEASFGCGLRSFGGDGVINLIERWLGSEALFACGLRSFWWGGYWFNIINKGLV